MNATTQNPSDRKTGTIRKILVGVWKNLPPENANVILNDATANKEDLEALLGRPVIDITPAGHLAHAKRVVQYPIDLTRHASPTQFLSVMRGILTEFRDANRVGVITHRPLVAALRKLTDPFAGRIVKSAYFGSGSDRASNDWHERCDLLIVAGTPRVPGEAVQRRLCQLGDFASAGEDGRWGDVRWRVWTETGGRRVVTGKGYDHPAWNRAQQSLVRAAIVQAAGRGRAIMETGCDVVVLSTEWCGFDFIDHNRDIELSESEAKVLQLLTIYRRLFLIRISKEQPPLIEWIETREIARRVGLSERQTREILTRLESRRLICRVGERGGWRLADDTDCPSTRPAK